MLGLETVLGRDETLEFEDYLDRPEERPEPPRFQVEHSARVDMLKFINSSDVPHQTRHFFLFCTA